MDIDKLKTELVTDPESMGYAALSDADAAGAINLANRDYTIPLNSRTSLSWAMRTGRLADIETATTAGTPAIQSIALGVKHLLGRSDTEIDMSDSDHVAMIDGLVAGGVLDAANKAELVTMATSQRSRADELGLGQVRVGHVQEARR
jgi:hypothetical protein